MDTFYNQLDELGLVEYYQVLVDYGFDNWDSLATITERDLDRLGFKRGHRRLLQRRIADLQGHPRAQPLPNVTNIRSPPVMAVASPKSLMQPLTATPSSASSNGAQHELILPSIEKDDAYSHTVSSSSSSALNPTASNSSSAPDLGKGS